MASRVIVVGLEISVSVILAYVNGEKLLINKVVNNNVGINIDTILLSILYSPLDLNAF